MSQITTNLDARKLAKLIDHTLLRPDARESEFRKLCDESMHYGFMMVAINSFAVKLCKGFLISSQIHVGAAISFPLGQTTIESKLYETNDAISNGADEIDYVINIGKLKDGDFKYIEKEMTAIVETCRNNQVISKVIFENCLLSKAEIENVSKIALEVRPDFIKTSTGFSISGALIEDVLLMKSVVGDVVKVKASGGIRNLDNAIAFYEAGAERIGTSSGVRIMNEYEESIKQQIKSY